MECETQVIGGETHSSQCNYCKGGGMPPLVASRDLEPGNLASEILPSEEKIVPSSWKLGTWD